MKTNQKLRLAITLLLLPIANAFGGIGGALPHIEFTPDGRYDLGAPGKRPDTVYAATGVSINNGLHGHVQVALTAAQIIAMSATPVQLIAAPAATQTIVVTKVQFTITRTATAFTGGGVVIVQYSNTATGGGTQALDSTLAATVITGSSGTSVSSRNGAVMSDVAGATLQGVGLFISNQTAAFAAGTGTAVVDVWYDLE